MGARIETTTPETIRTSRRNVALRAGARIEMAWRLALAGRPIVALRAGARIETPSNTKSFKTTASRAPRGRAD